MERRSKKGSVGSFCCRALLFTTKTQVCNWLQRSDIKSGQIRYRNSHYVPISFPTE